MGKRTSNPLSVFVFPSTKLFPIRSRKLLHSLRLPILFLHRLPFCEHDPQFSTAFSLQFLLSPIFRLPLTLPCLIHSTLHHFPPANTPAAPLLWWVSATSSSSFSSSSVHFLSPMAMNFSHFWTSSPPSTTTQPPWFLVLG